MDNWKVGVLTTSSWHGKEEIGVLRTAQDVIDAGRRVKAYPVSLLKEELVTRRGRRAEGAWGIIGQYIDGSEEYLGTVGSKYCATDPDDWGSLNEAAVQAGGAPMGAFALSGGSKVLATYQVSEDGQFRTNLLLLDSFDGSVNLTCGFTAINVVCENTMRMSLQRDGKSMAKLRHTASLEERVPLLAASIIDAAAQGKTVRETYEAAEALRLTPRQAENVFNLLFPEAAADAGKAGKTRAENARDEGKAAMGIAVNNVGPNLATLWNAATYLVDRHWTGEARRIRGGGSQLDSMVLGSAGRRVEEIESIIQLVLADGSMLNTSVSMAREHGVDDRQIGRSVLSSMLGEDN